MDLYQWARVAVDEGDLAVIVVRGAAIHGFTLEVTPEGRESGIDATELIEAVAQCHRWAEEADAE